MSWIENEFVALFDVLSFPPLTMISGSVDGPEYVHCYSECMEKLVVKIFVKFYHFMAD